MLLKIKDVARYLNIHEITAYRWSQRGIIPGFRIGGQWRFKKDVLDQWMKDKCTWKI